MCDGSTYARSCNMHSLHSMLFACDHHTPLGCLLVRVGGAGHTHSWRRQRHGHRPTGMPCSRLTACVVSAAWQGTAAGALRMSTCCLRLPSAASGLTISRGLVARSGRPGCRGWE